MIKITETGAGVVEIVASGRLGKSDYDACTPEFERIARARGPLRVLLVMEDFHGWDLPGLWEELKFDVSHGGQMARVALICEREWQDWGARLAAPFFKAEMRTFAPGERGEAMDWLTRA